MKRVEDLREAYEAKKHEIKKRLKEFESVINGSDEDIFAELAFCICTPQSKAEICGLAVEALKKNNILYRGDSDEIRPFLNAARFSETKAGRMVEARELFTKGGKLAIKGKIFSFKAPDELRVWLAENVKGIGMKESSHFLRNIGLGTGFAILDRHIMKNLKEFGVIDKIRPLTKKRYLETEMLMGKFADTAGIPMEELDLLFWSEETGKIFK